MIIESTSPFKQLPANLDDRQALFLDGIRYSIEMADLAFTRLAATVKQISDSVDGSVPLEHETAIVSSFLDAWSMLDSVNRLRDLIQHLPLLDKSSAPVVLFLQRTQTVKDMRDKIQHLREQIMFMADQRWPAWGAISWFAVSDKQKEVGRICSIVAGRLIASEINAVAPVGQPIRGNLDLITLFHRDKQISLSALHSAIYSLAKSIEQSLANNVKGTSPGTTDVMTCLEISFKASDQP